MLARYAIPSLTADYGDPAGEVRACREDCALFDFSFVQRARVEGAGAGELVAEFANRGADDMPAGTIRYALRLRDDGTVLSDLTVWKMSDEHFEIMSGHPPDIADLCAAGGSSMHPHAQDTAIFAVQGPNSLRKLDPLCSHPERLAALRYFEHDTVSIGGVECLVGRLGYTGEAGFELICTKYHAGRLWSLLSSQITPGGFIAADVLRIEAGFPLFWNDFVIPVTPAEAGLAHFAGGDGAPISNPLKRICFSAASAKHPRMWRFKQPPGRPVSAGEVAATSACFSVRMNCVVGLGYVAASTDLANAPLVDPSGAFSELRAQTLPIYDAGKARPRAEWR